MKQIFTNENRLLAMNSKNILEQAGIQVVVKNEHGSDGAMPGHQAWLELWVNEQDYIKALELLDTDSMPAEPWLCQSCEEQVPTQFQVCWNCQTERLAETENAEEVSAV
jgi:putative signal transducing protein